MDTIIQRNVGAYLTIGLVCALGGCVHPLSRTAEQAMHERLVQLQRAYRDAVADAQQNISVARRESEVDKYLANEKLEGEGSLLELADRIGGPGSYAEAKLLLGKDLKGRAVDTNLIDQRFELRAKMRDIEEEARKKIGNIKIDADTAGRELNDQDKQRIDQIRREADEQIEQVRQQMRDIDQKIDAQQTPMVRMTLQQAIELSARNNLDVKLAQLVPAIADTQVTQAEAIFDATLFSTFSFSKEDTPRPPTAFMGLAFLGTLQRQETRLTTGIRKVLTTGGQIQTSTTFARNSQTPPTFVVDPFYDANVELSLTQPLLRNFGSDVTRAQIMLSRNARDESVEDLRTTMLGVTAACEQAYWRLVFAQYQLLVQTRLYYETKELRRIIVERKTLDTRSDAIADAQSREELRRADMIRAQQNVRAASDALKQLLYARNLPLSDETVILPLDSPADAPVSYSLAEAITTALRRRPEMRRALLEIDDASIRQRVADNQRLPILDFSFTTRLNGVGLSSIGGAYDLVDDADFIDYIIALNFEVPIGNRGPEAAFEQRKIERRATVINYQRTAQRVVREVKDATRTLETAFEIIGAARAARRAAAERLRVLRTIERLDASTIDLRLRAQETLAQAAIQEMQALSEYHAAIARFNQAKGTLLEQSGIEFEDPLKSGD